jgi:hypothetical protein
MTMFSFFFHLPPPSQFLIELATSAVAIFQAESSEREQQQLMPNLRLFLKNGRSKTREYLRGEYHCSVDILFDWFRQVCLAKKNKKCQLSYS